MDDSDLLSLVSLEGLPRNPKTLMWLFQHHMDVPALLLCQAKVKQIRA